MRTLRSLLFVIWLYGAMAVIGLAATPALLMPRGAMMLFIRAFVRTMLFGLRWICGITVEFRGAEHVPEGQALIAGKHQAMLDVFVPFLIFRDPIIVMKRELLWYPILGWVALKSEMLPIDRDGGTKTMKRMLQVAKARVPEGEGRQMLIYPEGTRQFPGSPPDYKPAGVRAFYKALDLPIIPLATNSGMHWPPRGLIRTPGHVVYEALPPIPAGVPQKAMMAQLQADLENASDRLAMDPQDARRKGAIL